ncbi:MAG TPA: Crp/Fnr family transcriptional regulator [Burkholderiaceae bacterium]|nr:Crp/Fnr family transcriptional regulator [Burkholderiaceae bacterium]
MRVQPGLGTLPPLFQALSTVDRGLLRDTGRLAMLGKGERLIRAGQIVDTVAFIYAGWVALESRGVSVLLLRPGETCLNAFDLEARRSDVDVRAMSPASVALIDRRALRGLLPRYPEVFYTLFQRVMQRVESLFIAQARQGPDPLEVRLAWLLWTLGEPEADGTRRVSNEVPQSVLASLLGASREEINRKRRMLMRAGFIIPDTDGTRLAASIALLLGAHDYPV